MTGSPARRRYNGEAMRSQSAQAVSLLTLLSVCAAAPAAGPAADPSWDIETGRQLLSLRPAHPEKFPEAVAGAPGKRVTEAPALAFSPDGTLAAGFPSDRFTGIWRVEPAPPAPLDAEGARAALISALENPPAGVNDGRAARGR